MITRNELKYYSSLLKKKSRDEHNKFIVEGTKIVLDGLDSNIKCEIIFMSYEFMEMNKFLVTKLEKKGLKVEILKNQDYSKLTDTKSPQGISAVFHKPVHKTKSIESINSNLVVCLENISDPGNLGTILRNSDWFGVKEILLINNCADVYNPKTIRASMGSIFHLNIFELNELNDDLKKLKRSGYKVLCTDLSGKNIFEFQPSSKCVITFSNEANGISQNLLDMADDNITIPEMGKAESLNVASASAVILAILSNKNSSCILSGNKAN